MARDIENPCDLMHDPTLATLDHLESARRRLGFVDVVEGAVRTGITEPTIPIQYVETSGRLHKAMI